MQQLCSMLMDAATAKIYPSLHTLTLHDALPIAGTLIAVLPPTLLSTCASRVVGTWMKLQPRLTMLHANPTRSPITPPPRAMTWSPRSTPSAINDSVSRARHAPLFVPTPGSRRSEERRGGKECVRTCSSGGWTEH